MGTSGIPPKIIYRCVKSYKSHARTSLQNLSKLVRECLHFYYKRIACLGPKNSNVATFLLHIQSVIRAELLYWPTHVFTQIGSSHLLQIKPANNTATITVNHEAEPIFVLPIPQFNREDSLLCEFSVFISQTNNNSNNVHLLKYYFWSITFFLY